MAALALPLILALLPSTSWAARVFQEQNLELETQRPPAHLDRLAARGSDLQAFRAAVKANEERAAVLLDISGTAKDPNWPDELKSELGHARKVGEGTYGSVYVAPLKCSPDFRVAVKVMKEEFGYLSATDVANEVNAMKAAAGHPNIMQYFRDAKRSQEHFIVMEAARGGDLGDYMQSEDNNLGLFLGMLRGVKEMHDRGMLHRDLKPANVLVSEKCGWEAGTTCTAKLADLGFSCSVKESKLGAPLCEQGEIVGTPSYMSAEAWSGHLTRKTDVWAMGMILYRMKFNSSPKPIEKAMTGGLEDMEQAVTAFDILTDENYKSLPKSEWKELLAGMLAKDRKARWGSSTALAAVEAWGKKSFAVRASGQLPELPACFGKTAAR